MGGAVGSGAPGWRLVRGRRLAPLTDEKIQRTKKPVERLSDEHRNVYEALREWRKRAAQARRADASLILPRSTMLELSCLRNKPRDLDGLTNLGLLEPWRIQYCGEGILAALANQGGSREDSGTRKSMKKRSSKRRKAGNRSPGGDPYLG